MKGGEIVQRGRSQDVYDFPEDEYTAGLFGRYNTLSDSLRKALGIGEKIAIVRPESLSLTAEGPDGIGVLIKSVLYYGSFSEAVVESEYGILVVRVPVNGFATGQRAILTALRK
jgi:ABC-type Fe3+/spermidine/putrescine transport system ATPase subunit